MGHAVACKLERPRVVNQIATLPDWSLHDTGSTFIPVRVHSGSLLWFCIRLHDTRQKRTPERVIPVRVHCFYFTGAGSDYQSGTKTHPDVVKTR